MTEQVRDQTTNLRAAVERAVDETKQKERALVLSARLASIGTLAAGVAHEVNNPIGGMLNAIHRLMQQPDLTEKERTYLQLVQDGLSRIARTTRQLLDFSPRSAAAGSFALRAPIDGAKALVEHRLRSQNVELDLRVPADLPPLFGDAHEIQQVVLNLLLNSLDALADQRGASGGGRIEVRATAENGQVRFEVRDDGPGMDPQDLGRVFDPFFSKKKRPDASGLGMFICYSIVHNHGGDMRVESEPGMGFQVHVTLPVASTSAGAG
jgi:signal transduction histidine kinase